MIFDGIVDKGKAFEELEEYIDAKNLEKLNENYVDYIKKKIEEISEQQMINYQINIKEASDIILVRHPNIDSIEFVSGTNNHYKLSDNEQIQNLMINKSLNSANDYLKNKIENFNFQVSELSSYQQLGKILVLTGFKRNRYFFHEIYTFLVVINGLERILANKCANIRLSALDLESTIILAEKKAIDKNPSVILKTPRGTLGFYFQTEIKGFSSVKHTPDIAIACYKQTIPEKLDLNNVSGIIECKDVKHIGLKLVREFMGYLLDIVPLFFIVVSARSASGRKRNLKPYGIEIIDDMDPIKTTKLSFHVKLDNLKDYIGNAIAYEQLKKRASLLGEKEDKLAVLQWLFKEE